MSTTLRDLVKDLPTGDRAKPDTLASKLQSMSDRLAQAAKLGESAFAAKLQAAPQALDCPRHGQLARELRHDLSTAQLKLVYQCPACHAEREAAQWRHTQSQAGIPHNVRHALLRNFQTERPHVTPGDAYASPAEFLLAAREIDQRRKRNLVLAGSTGIGKGHLAAALANARLARGHSVRWAHVGRLFDELHATYAKSSPVSKEQLIARYARPALLVLDELAIAPMPTDGELFLFEILDERDQRARQTVCTTNLPQPEVEQWLGDRNFDRLRNGGLYYCYGKWQSMRGETETQDQE